MWVSEWECGWVGVWVGVWVRECINDYCLKPLVHCDATYQKEHYSTRWLCGIPQRGLYGRPTPRFLLRKRLSYCVCPVSVRAEYITMLIFCIPHMVHYCENMRWNIFEPDIKIISIRDFVQEELNSCSLKTKIFKTWWNQETNPRIQLFWISQLTSIPVNSTTVNVSRFIYGGWFLRYYKDYPEGYACFMVVYITHLSRDVPRPPFRQWSIVSRDNLIHRQSPSQQGVSQISKEMCRLYDWCYCRRICQQV